MFGGFDEALEWTWHCLLRRIDIDHVLLYVHNALNFREIHLIRLLMFMLYLLSFFFLLDVTRLDQR